MLTFFRWLQIQCLWHVLQFCLWCWVMELKRLVIFLVKWHRTRSQWYNANCMSELLQIRMWPILKQGLRSKLLRLHKPVESISQFIDFFFKIQRVGYHLMCVESWPCNRHYLYVAAYRIVVKRILNSCAKQNRPLPRLFSIRGRNTIKTICLPFWLFVSFTVAGERHCEDFFSNGPTAEILLDHHIHSGSPEIISTGGSQVEHLKSVKAEQFYDHTLFSTMLLYHGS